MGGHAGRTIAFLALLVSCLSAGWPEEGGAQLLSPAVRESPERGFSLEVTPTTTVIFGRARELVLGGYLYSGSPLYPDTYLTSELDWALSPMILTGSRLRLEAGTGLFASLEASLAFQGRSGTVTDSDYLNGDGMKTHFSEHECYIEHGLLLDGRLGWSVFGAKKTRISFYLSFSYLRFKWSGRNGYYQYDTGESYPFSYWYADKAQTPVYGTVFCYEQNYYIPAAGIETELRLGNRFRISMSNEFAPWLWCDDIDNHLAPGKKIDYYTSMAGGAMVHPALTLTFTPCERYTVSLDMSYRHISDLRGQTTMQYASSGTVVTPEGEGGAALETLSAALGFHITL